MKFTLQIRPSAIHGRGLFAGRAYKPGLVLGRCNAIPTGREGPYTLSTDEGDVEVTCRLKYINHSDSPNVCYYDDLTVVTLRHIEAGEEITHDYGDAWR